MLYFLCIEFNIIVITTKYQFRSVIFDYNELIKQLMYTKRRQRFRTTARKVKCMWIM